MKKLPLFFLFIFLNVYSQKPQSGLLLTIGSEYTEAEVTFNDDHVEKGFVYGFIDNRIIEIANPLSPGLETLESSLNFNDKKFKFKSKLEAEAVILTTDEIRRVKMFRKNGKVEDFWLMDLKTANIKGEIIDLKKKVWLPVYEQGKVNMFAYDLYTEGKYFFTAIYLNNSKDNVAIAPLDINRINFFNMSKIDDKIFSVLNEVFKDCPEYIVRINEDREQTLHEKFKGSKQDKIDRKALKEESKGLSKNEKIHLENNLRREIWMDPYLKFVKEYTATCPN